MAALALPMAALAFPIAALDFPIAALAFPAAVALLGACGPSSPPPLPPPAVDLIGQSGAAGEIVDTTLLARHLDGVAAADDPTRYLASELWRIGLAPGGPRGSWIQPYEEGHRIARPRAALLIERGGAHETLVEGRDVVAALGGRWGSVRLRGLPTVFAAPALAVPAGALASKVVAVVEPAAPADASALPDLFRRAAAAGAHAVLVLPRPGAGSQLPSRERAAQLVAGSGLPLAIWVSEPAARAFLPALLGVPLDAMPRLEGRLDLLPLALGVLHGEVNGSLARHPYRNLVAVLPARGGSDEAVAVVATVPARGRARNSAAAPDLRGQVAAAAELLAVATAFQALSDPPRRTVLFVFTEPGGDGLAGARRLAADLRWGGPHLAAAVVLASGNVEGPTRDVTFVGAQASPLYGMAARIAALQGRQVGADPAPWRRVLWGSPAWPLIQAGVPTALLEPGTVPRAPDAGLDGANLVSPAAARGPRGVAPRTPGVAALVSDARLAFRLALELAEGGRPPRVDAATVEATLRAPVAVPVPVAPPAPRRPRPAATPAVIEGIGASAEGAGAPTGGEEAAPEGPSLPTPSDVPAFVAPPPPAESPAPAEAPPPAPTPTPPQR